MDYELTPSQKSTLNVMYYSVKDALTASSYADRSKKGSSECKSVLYSLIRRQSNDRAALLGKSEDIILEKEDIDPLLNGGFIREGTALGRYQLTAKGIWEVEGSIVDVDDILLRIEFDYLMLQSDITPKNIIIMTSLLAGRSFGPDAKLDLSGDTRIMDLWGEVFNQCSDFLVELGVIKEKDSTRCYKPKSTIEHPTSVLARHVDSLPRNTYHIFTNSGNNGHYLAVDDGNKLDDKKLSRIIRLCFKDKLTYESRYEISKFLLMFYDLYMWDISEETYKKKYVGSDIDTIIDHAIDLALEQNDVS